MIITFKTMFPCYPAKGMVQLDSPVSVCISSSQLRPQGSPKSIIEWAHLSKETNTTILSNVLSKTRNSTFQSLIQHSKETHVLDSELRDDHITSIVKLIAKN